MWGKVRGKIHTVGLFPLFTLPEDSKSSVSTSQYNQFATHTPLTAQRSVTIEEQAAVLEAAIATDKQAATIPAEKIDEAGAEKIERARKIVYVMRIVETAIAGAKHNMDIAVSQRGKEEYSLPEELLEILKKDKPLFGDAETYIANNMPETARAINFIWLRQGGIDITQKVKQIPLQTEAQAREAEEAKEIEKAVVGVDDDAKSDFSLRVR